MKLVVGSGLPNDQFRMVDNHVRNHNNHNILFILEHMGNDIISQLLCETMWDGISWPIQGWRAYMGCQANSNLIQSIQSRDVVCEGC